jgi:hypothetical protein
VNPKISGIEPDLTSIFVQPLATTGHLGCQENHHTFIFSV